MQLTSKDIAAFINSNALPFELSKVGKRWIVTNTIQGEDYKFDNLKQVNNWLLIQSKSFNQDGIAPESKQGGDAIKIDSTKLVFIDRLMEAPVPSSTIDKKATAKLAEDISTINHTAIVAQLKIDTNEKGKACLPEELRKVSNIKHSFDKLIEKYCLAFSYRGKRAVSVHHRDLIENAIKETHDALTKQAQLIVAKLDDWKEESIAQGRYVEGKFPTAAYFTNTYRCEGFFTAVSGAFDYEHELVESQINKVKNDVNHAINAISDFLTNDKKKVRENSISNIAESFGVLKESGLVTGAAVERLIEKAEAVVSSVDLEKVRNAQKAIEKGIVTPVQGKRGRKATPVTADDIKEFQKVVDTALDPLQDLASELEGLV